jgi:hypothetical protein
MSEDADDGYTYWEIDTYRIRQLLPSDGFVAVFFDDNVTPWTLRTEPLMFLGLADQTTRFMRAPTKDRGNGDYTTSREYRNPYKTQKLVGVSFYLNNPLTIVNAFANCIGIMPSTENAVEFAKANLFKDQLKMFAFSEVPDAEAH